MNRTPTKAIQGKTPFEAAFGKKSDLSKVREWGEKVWVRLETGDKLGGRVREGRWMGVADESKGIRVYWPAMKSVTTERNVYYDKTGSSVSHFEGEEWDGFVETKTDLPLPQKQSPSQIPTETPNIDTAEPSNDPKFIENQSETDADQSDAETHPKRVRKPTQRVKDLLTGKDIASNLPKGAKIAPGIQLPTPNEPESALAGEEIDFCEEYALAAEISEMEVLEPQTLKEVRSRPDWLL
ncbi:hypothetical protein BYT27DRAFT_7319986, partial [Phlegmacium glaucopus]